MQILSFLILVFILTSCNSPKTNNQTIKKNQSFTYVVQNGDNLTKISEKYNLAVSDIKNWNKLKSDIIHPSQRLNLYFPINFGNNIRFGMSKKELLDNLKLIPLIDTCRSYDSNYKPLELFRFNYNTVTNEIDNKSICNLEFNKIAEISYIDFVFDNDSLIIIEITRRDGIELELTKLLKNLKDNNFEISKIGFDFYTGFGKKFGHNAKVQITWATEMAIIFEKYSKNS
jgi:hypothetical protein